MAERQRPRGGRRFHRRAPGGDPGAEHVVPAQLIIPSLVPRPSAHLPGESRRRIASLVEHRLRSRRGVGRARHDGASLPDRADHGCTDRRAASDDVDHGGDVRARESAVRGNAHRGRGGHVPSGPFPRWMGGISVAASLAQLVLFERGGRHRGPVGAERLADLRALSIVPDLARADRGHHVPPAPVAKEAADSVAPGRGAAETISSAASFGYWAALATGLSKLVTFAIAIATPPLSGPLCKEGASAYPYLDVAVRFPRDYFWLFPAIVATLLYLAFTIALYARVAVQGRQFAQLGLGARPSWRR